MQEAVEGGHLHGYSDSSLAPPSSTSSTALVTVTASTPYRAEENLNVNDASFILWKLSHEPDSDHDAERRDSLSAPTGEPLLLVTQEHLKV